ncbi:DUF6870 family protein [Ruminococcus sp. 5_1_39BFAA]|uniref:DUF6870 family protein n=1 Tax=Ruminococcus sp. 5_1_39BFAA TaxID=457412 RepID=UPI00356B5D1C
MISILHMEDVDIRSVDPGSLVDIEQVEIHSELPKEERWKNFVEQIKNPRCYICNGMVVKVSYNNQEERLEQKLMDLIMALHEV